MSAPGYTLPKGACDSHLHVFGDPAAFHLSPARSYTPLPAPLDAYQALQRQAGLERIVLVQPSVYGTDCSCMLDALRRLGGTGRAVAVIDDTVTDEALEAMHADGVRGARINVVSGKLPDLGRLAETLRRTDARIHRFGWHIQLFADLLTLHSMKAVLAGLSTDIVVDHFALASTPKDAGFEAVLEMLRGGKLWVKLSAPYRVSQREPDYDDLSSLVDALVRTNPDRLVWGSDWPHTPQHASKPGHDAAPLPYRKVDFGGLLRALGEWTGDRETLRRILVENPARLYDFG